MRLFFRKKDIFVCFLVFMVLFANVSFANQEKKQAPKNVVIMIADGIGFNGWLAQKYYFSGKEKFYPRLKESKFYGMTSWSKTVVRTSTNPLVKSQNTGYIPKSRWQKFKNSFSNDFSPINRNYQSYTDSAASASAMFSGKKVENSKLNYIDEKQYLETIFESLSKKGYKTGVISSSHFYDATPSASVVHQKSRYLKENIINEMLESDLDVIIGGVKKDVPPWYIKKAKLQGFEFTKNIKKASQSEKLLAVFDNLIKKYDTYDKRVKEKPKLATMAKKAISVLEKNNDKGFLLLIEGGQVDWANHMNNIDYMLDEMKDFNMAVDVVYDWIEKNPREQTLLIVTSDHETGGIWGKNTYKDNNNDGKYSPNIDEFNSFKVPYFSKVGEKPKIQYASKNHTNELVPMWCYHNVNLKFCDVENKLYDEKAQKLWGQEFDWKGFYIDNTDIYRLIKKHNH